VKAGRTSELACDSLRAFVRSIAKQYSATAMTPQADITTTTIATSMHANTLVATMIDA